MKQVPSLLLSFSVLIACILTQNSEARTLASSASSSSVSTLLPRIVNSRGGGRRSKNIPPPVVEQPKGPLQSFIGTVKESRRHLAAAAAARCVSIFTMFPVDTIKTRLQMDMTNPFKLDGLYNGVGGSLIGQVPYGVLTFGSYEMYKKTFLNRFPNIEPVFVYAMAAICGDVTGSGWICPSEVIKQQTQAGMYTNTGAAVKGIFKKSGFGWFYEGYFGGLARDIPFRVAQLTSYELTKNFYLRLRQSKSKSDGKSKDGGDATSLSPIEAAACGALAGSFSAAITAPLDRIKTLLMTDSAAYGGSVASCLSKIYNEEGVAGLCQGMVPRVTYIAPSVVIFFIVYETVQQRLAEPAV